MVLIFFNAKSVEHVDSNEIFERFCYDCHTKPLGGEKEEEKFTT